MNNDSLEHHGILGQKWGVRNGPPYPLSGSKHSSSEKKAGWRSSLEKSGNTSYNKSKGKNGTSKQVKDGDGEHEKKGLTDGQKKAITIGAAAVATFLVAYGTYKLADSGELNRLAMNGKAWLDKNKGTGFKRNNQLSKKMSAEEIFKNVIPQINKDKDASILKKFGTNTNCKRCTYAYEMCRRGFDVQATKSKSGAGQDGLGTYNAIHEGPFMTWRKYAKEKEKYGPNETYDKIFTSMKRQPIRIDSGNPSESIFRFLANYPNGSRGELVIKWKYGCSHSMAWEIISGKPVIYDCQHQQMFDTSKKFESDAADIETLSSLRLDHQKLNYEFLKRWCKNRY